MSWASREQMLLSIIILIFIYYFSLNTYYSYNHSNLVFHHHHNFLLSFFFAITCRDEGIGRSLSKPVPSQNQARKQVNFDGDHDSNRRGMGLEFWASSC